MEAVGDEGALSRFRNGRRPKGASLAGLSVWVELGMLDSYGVDTKTLRKWAQEINDDPTLTVHEAAKILRTVRHDMLAKAKANGWTHKAKRKR